MLVNPYRCAQCMRRFFGYRSARVKRTVLFLLGVLPVLILVVWFVELYRFQQASASRPAEQPVKKGALSPADINKLLKTP